MSELIKLFEFTANQARAMAAEQSVAGEPLVIDNVTLIPVSKLSCGFTGGGSDLAAKKRGDGLMGGAGVKISKTPLSYIAVCDGQVQMLYVGQEETGKKGIVGSLMPMVEQFKAKLAEKKAAKAAEEETK